MEACTQNVCTEAVRLCDQIDASDARVAARIEQEFMGAAPRAATGVDGALSRLDTFKQTDNVRTSQF